MGCNCNKNKNNEPQDNKQQFRKQEIPEQSLVKKKMSMLQSFATAVASRGLQDNKVNMPLKQLRVVSCFGNEQQGGVLPPCEHLKESKTPGKHFCGGCGCGDKEGTWLMAEADKYSKLDYPKLNCPLAMPGFSNYQQSKEDEGVEPVTRRWFIENKVSYNDIKQIPVTVHESKQGQQPT